MDNESPPVISGLLATKCDNPDCFVKTSPLLAEAFCDWICPHCRSHLGIGRICLNMCGLSYPAAKKFNAMLASAASQLPQPRRASDE